MIVVRNIFKLKFGHSPEATEIWKRLTGMMKGADIARGGIRLLTDLAGASFYTIVLETTHDSLAEWEKASQALRSNPEWKQLYQKLFAITESGSREILSIIE